MTSTSGNQSESLSSRLLPALGAVIGLAVLVVGVMIMADRNAATNLLGGIFEALGNAQAAADLERGVGEQGLAKLLLAAVALVVGVGGIWLMYIGVSAIVGLFGPRWAGRGRDVALHRADTTAILSPVLPAACSPNALAPTGRVTGSAAGPAVILPTLARLRGLGTPRGRLPYFFLALAEPGS